MGQISLMHQNNNIHHVQLIHMLGRRGLDGTCIFGKLKTWVYQCEEMRNLGNQRHEDRRSEDFKMDILKIDVTIKIR